MEIKVGTIVNYKVKSGDIHLLPKGTAAGNMLPAEVVKIKDGLTHIKIINQADERDFTVVAVEGTDHGTFQWSPKDEARNPAKQHNAGDRVANDADAKKSKKIAQEVSEAEAEIAQDDAEKRSGQHHKPHHK